MGKLRQVVHESNVLLTLLVIVDEGPLNRHHTFIGRFCHSVDVNRAKEIVCCRLDKGQGVRVALLDCSLGRSHFLV